MNPDKLSWDFSYHTPNKQKKEAHEAIRAHCLSLARIINEETPDSREKSLAITNLEQVMFWANAGIARNPRPDGTS